MRISPKKPNGGMKNNFNQDLKIELEQTSNTEIGVPNASNKGIKAANNRLGVNGKLAQELNNQSQQVITTTLEAGRKNEQEMASRNKHASLDRDYG